MNSLILIRHGESRGNVEGLFRGRIDYPLTERGKEQAELLASELKRFSVKKIYTSPLNRCLQTAEFIKVSTGAEIIKEEGLNNIRLGKWEGKPKSFIKERWPDLWQLWLKEPERLNIPEAETLTRVQARAYRIVREIIKEGEEGSVALVTHRAVLKPLIAKLLNIPPPYFWKVHMDNCAYSIFEVDRDRGFTLVLLNQTRHLKGFIEEKI